MASITLAEAQKLGLDDLVTGVIENIVDTNPMYNALPFQDIAGNAKTYNREATLGDTQVVGVDGTITAKAAPTYTKVTANLTSIIGDAEVNRLISSQRVGGDIIAQNIGSKAKNVGRHYQHMFFEGESGAQTLVPSSSPKFAYDVDEFDGLRKTVAGLAASQTVTLSGALTFEALDELLHAVKSKDGQVDALVMSARTIRSFRALNRALGGSHMDQVEVNGITMEAYAGVPLFRSDYIPTDIDNSLGTGTATDTVVYAINFDSGSEADGIAGLTTADNMGISVTPGGLMETKDSNFWRVAFYSSMAVYSGLSVAMLDEVSN